MHTVKRAGQVDGHHIVPSVGGQHIEIALGGVGACAVDQDVDVSVLGYDLVGHGFDGVLVGHVQQHRFCAAHRLQSGQSTGVGGRVAPRNDHVCTGFDQFQRAGQTNAATATCDPSHLAF